MFIATTLSVTGGALLMLTYVLQAHYTWLVGDLIWHGYFRMKKDIWGEILVTIYLIEILIGIWMWSN